jgi:predicted RNA-binding protein with PUA-like domain
MQVGDTAFFYHSNIPQPAVVGLAEIVEEKVVDPTQFDPNSRYYDQRSQPDAPRWYTVKLKFVEKFIKEIPLKTLKARFNPEEFMLVMRGSRLSVMPVEPSVAERILNLAKS